MPCRSKVTATYRAGTLQRVEFCCDGRCEDGTKCCIQISFDQHGGSRTWCGCGPREPRECHIVLVTPGPGSGGGTPEFVCAGSCPKGQICKLMRKRVRPNVFELSCECVPG